MLEALLLQPITAEQIANLPYRLLIYPLEWCMGHIFHYFYGLSGSLGWSILLLSAAINTLLLPLYYLGDRIQLREQALQAGLQTKLDEFRRAFSGSMLHMVQKTLYRQRGYHPIYGLRNSIGFAIQVPFFIAAYHFLSHLELLQGQAWALIPDLSLPDGLLPIGFGSYSNLLPWLMTGLNLLSGLAYTAQAPYSNPASKRQLWGIAVLFLVLLYYSPAALLLYWSFSNLYSLVKNLVSANHKQGAAYWRKVAQSSRLAAGKLPALKRYVLPLLEYGLAVLGLFLLARFKMLDSIDKEANIAMYRGTICWYGFAVLQVIRPFRYLLPFSRAAPSTLRQKCLGLVHLLIPAGALLAQQIPFLIDAFDEIEMSAVAPVILSLSIILAIAPRPWQSPVFLTLQRHKNPSAVRQLAAGSTAALLGLGLFNSSALLFSSPSESPHAIPALLGQVLPGFTLALLVSLVVFLWLGRRFAAQGKYQGKYQGRYQGTYPVVSKVALPVAFFGSGCLLLALVNNFVLQYDYGVMTSWVFDQPEKLLIPMSTILLVLALLPLLYLLWLVLLRRLQILIVLCWILAAGLWSSSAYYSLSLLRFGNGTEITEQIASSQDDADNAEGKLQSVYSYSREQNNVLIIMVDRFIGPYLENILELDPEVKDSLDGFTWYKNTSSPGPSTISGLTALLGGHEYSPDAISELPGNLKDKINQAYLLLPTLFQQNGYDSMVSDPSWANFDWKGDLDMFRRRGIRAERLKGRYTGRWLQQQAGRNSKQDRPGVDLRQPQYAAVMVLQAVFRALPPPLAPLVYDEGSWLGSNFAAGNLFSDLVNTWSSLVVLPQISDAEAKKPQFIFMTNDTPHEPMAMGYNPGDPRYPFLPMPEQPNESGSPLPPALLRELQGKSDYSLRHFYADWATIKELRRYLGWMKQQRVYDNSLIILASDHGRDVQLPNVDLGPNETDYAYFMPLLLVKPPGAKGPLKLDITAHSTADVPAFAGRFLSEQNNSSQKTPSQRNPFTGKTLKFQDPDAPRYSYYIGQNPNDQKGDRFDVEKSYRIDGPIWQRESWERLP
ncbi:YidC/Oxa1 family membrane protein insertase [Candidatus Haliotispira prima]|uniref:YidC/Oxa1 family membrane protein insertase n=1 Tax=Candidatus Haliotispira prima TaxID=3034016 RepID=A0ABY8MK36_9SPIO|nr:YidC/Oxa1 family membrane protein insertase [Candidatus Haliotispira prima]